MLVVLIALDSRGPAGGNAAVSRLVDAGLLARPQAD
jgi:hypothetical protein